MRTRLPKLVIEDPARDPGRVMVYRAKRAKGCRKMSHEECMQHEARMKAHFKEII